MTIPSIDETHDPSRTSWVSSANGHSAFPVQNLPLGVFSPEGASDPRAGAAIGDQILDLRAAAAAGLLPEPAAAALRGAELNALFSLPSADRRSLRQRLSALLGDIAYRLTVESLLFPAADCEMQRPARIGDYTDFYAGINHAVNVGHLFRPDNPLLPNYKYVPIGYHGRASSVMVSGTPVIRPNGQHKPPDADAPVFGPSQRLDYELELGIWVGEGNPLGASIPIGAAASHIAGYCLLNDWSARDFQAWEYQPLGPFLAKNFITTISPWVITAEALAPFQIAQPRRREGDPAPLPYLWDESDQQRGALAIDLSVSLRTARMRQNGDPAFVLSHGEAKHLYWTSAQLVAHHASNGCNLNSGDLLGTGTISAPGDHGFGSLLEQSRGGTTPVRLPNGESRNFLEDGDEIAFAATARAEGFVPIGFGPCAGQIEAAR